MDLLFLPSDYRGRRGRMAIGFTLEEVYVVFPKPGLYTLEEVYVVFPRPGLYTLEEVYVVFPKPGLYTL